VRTFSVNGTDARTVYVWLVFATPLVAAAFSLVHMGRLVSIPYEVSYGERLVLWQSPHILSSRTVCHSITGDASARRSAIHS
jgi:hypothetical protein